MKKFISQNFSLVLFAGCIIGLFTPDPGKIISYIIPVLLALVVFTSLFQVDFAPKKIIDQTGELSKFYLWRHIVFPICIYFALQHISVFYATSLFLLSLLPPAVSSPAFASFMGGETSISVTGMVLYNMFTPILIPVMCGIIIGKNQEFDIIKMCTTLFFTIILPLILHFPLRKKEAVSNWCKENSAPLAVICIALMFVAAVSRYKTEIYNNIHIIPVYIIISFIAYSALYLTGWMIKYKAGTDKRISYGIGSGAINIGLGVTLTILYFSADINLFFIVSQLVWSIVLIPVKRVFSYLNRKNGIMN